MTVNPKEHKSNIYFVQFHNFPWTWFNPTHNRVLSDLVTSGINLSSKYSFVTPHTPLRQTLHLHPSSVRTVQRSRCCWVSADVQISDPDRTEHLQPPKQANFPPRLNFQHLQCVWWNMHVKDRQGVAEKKCNTMLCIYPACVWHRIREKDCLSLMDRNIPLFRLWATIALFSYLWHTVVFSPAKNVQNSVWKQPRFVPAVQMNYLCRTQT